MDISSTDIACNQGGNVGTNDTFVINAGSDMTFQWTDVRPLFPYLLDTFRLIFISSTQSSGLIVTRVP